MNAHSNFCNTAYYIPSLFTSIALNVKQHICFFLPVQLRNCSCIACPKAATVTQYCVTIYLTHLPARFGHATAKFVELNSSVLVDVANLDELGNLLVGRVLSKFIQYCLYLAAADVPILVLIVRVEHLFERSFFLRCKLCCLRMQSA